MNNNKQDTKNRILEVSLDLFSRRGYSSVSIRDICGEVGIKESTVYYHFKNKQDIFDVLCESFTAVTYAMPEEFAVQMAQVTSVQAEEFIFVCQSFLNDYLMDPKVNRFIRMLILEQGTNPEAAALYHRVLFDEALAGQKLIFEWLVGIGFLKAGDLTGMVMDYYAPVVYLFHRYLVADELTEVIRAEANQKLIEHVQHFLAQYRAVE
ncbi:TetR/AcrR family transcriptional regulator [Paenibacillus donghaensis]|uniref:HTH tetR-type domain-containing protein n=1 Tax=Paenibacillus donghaensis TaxID=414771 RepID=A0A2Z2KJJ9_9BACL|nr:TetR/AcrR family transcriptional regulator [Paenibacillus donghaensis]ASA22489.1 hypothetical protein B9T62_17890 [Paenibacillus donghaensis]